MADYIYDRMITVTVKNNDSEFEFKHIMGFEEYDHEIEIETDVQIDCLNRGYIGDLFYHAKGASLHNPQKEVTTVTCFKEVLLARITISAQPNCTIVWKYNFLKD